MNDLIYERLSKHPALFFQLNELDSYPLHIIRYLLVTGIITATLFLPEKHTRDLRDNTGTVKAVIYRRMGNVTSDGVVLFGGAIYEMRGRLSVEVFAEEFGSSAQRHRPPGSSYPTPFHSNALSQI